MLNCFMNYLSISKNKFKKTFHISSNHKKQISSQEPASDPCTPSVTDDSEGWVFTVTDSCSVYGNNDFKKGDILHLENTYYERWWIAKNSRTGQTFQVFDDWITDRPGESVAFDAWQNIGREEALKQLLVPNLNLGTYILRPGSDAKCYVLCVLYEVSGERDVKFYQIHTTDDQTQYYMQPEHTFPSLDELLEFYSGMFFLF
ncbi:unnamed protein product [Dibothriocephalus latus]|uniref:SH2 domain-containing protein n=1 Tax=Dibothriocephalus latus TaxID=60516 RepID=A0A3P6V1D8_DIBLA|nr:unnamed protein product [Dibothriocephalus latus]